MQLLWLNRFLFLIKDLFVIAATLCFVYIGNLVYKLAIKQRLYYLLQKNFPRTLEALILHLLSPVGAEVLTCKFEEMDQQITEEDR